MQWFIETSEPPERPLDSSSLVELIKKIASEMEARSDLADEMAAQLLLSLVVVGLRNLARIEPSKLENYLRRALRNVRTTMRIREAARHRREDEVARATSRLRQAQVGDNLDREELWLVMIDILGRYAPEQTENVFSLWLNDLSEEEIAEKIGKSRSTVRQEMARAKRILLRKLPERGFLVQ
jgi:RNA polymerase sigma factor (sigma-70 family)